MSRKYSLHFPLLPSPILSFGVNTLPHTLSSTKVHSFHQESLFLSDGFMGFTIYNTIYSGIRSSFTALETPRLHLFTPLSLAALVYL